ncbi:hypothetical protein FHG87_016534 [Trinorchestia longiramus]|nr:hypothetical protein FHG87_016534 [Trinorchestia longiramus]
MSISGQCCRCSAAQQMSNRDKSGNCASKRVLDDDFFSSWRLARRSSGQLGTAGPFHGECFVRSLSFLRRLGDPTNRGDKFLTFYDLWIYKRTNFELMKEELGSYNYEVLMNNKNAEECYMILKDKIATARDHHIPRKRIRPTNNPPWFSQEIKRLINARQHSYRRLKRYQTEPHRQEHIHACRAVKRTIKSTKRN